MRIQIILSGLLLSLALTLGSIAMAETGSGKPLKYISSCELDFNNDNAPDIALLAETVSGWELIALMRTAKGYEAVLVSRDNKGMELSCRLGKTVKETSSGNRGGKVYETPGAYIQLAQPEGASVVYFWDQNAFREVWTSD